MPNLDKNYKFVQFGYMVGGSLKDGEYSDESTAYSTTEGGIDYNAGLVGALGYLNAKINPVNDVSSPEPVASTFGCVISPNPVQDYLNIYFGEKSVKKVTIEVIDMMGAIRKTEEVSGRSNYSINLESLCKGIYLVRVVTENETYTKQIVKK